MFCAIICLVSTRFTFWYYHDQVFTQSIFYSNDIDIDTLHNLLPKQMIMNLCIKSICNTYMSSCFYAIYLCLKISSTFYTHDNKITKNYMRSKIKGNIYLQCFLELTLKR